MLIGIDASRAVTSRRTGTEAYAYLLIKALLPLATALDHHVVLYFNQTPPPDLFIEYPLVSWRVMPLTRLWTHARLGWELARHSPDVFFTPAHVIPFIFWGRSVATVHDLGFRHYPAAHTWDQRAYLRLTTRTNSALSTRLIADSQATKADLLRFYALEDQKIDVIYPGLDPRLKPVENDEVKADVRAKYGISAPYLLYIGTIQPRKNLVRLVQAYVASGLPHQLVLAGGMGWRSEPLSEQIAALQPSVRQRVLLPGFIADRDKAALISGATALLYPSLYEGFGFPILEGQVCHTPVLAAAASSLPEVAGDGALLVDPQDTAALAGALQRLVSDEDLRHDLIRRGAQNVKRFTWAKTAAAVLQTLEAAAR